MFVMSIRGVEWMLSFAAFSEARCSFYQLPEALAAHGLQFCPLPGIAPGVRASLAWGCTSKGLPVPRDGMMWKFKVLSVPGIGTILKGRSCSRTSCEINRCLCMSFSVSHCQPYSSHSHKL